MIPIPPTPMPSREFLLLHTLRIELIKREIEMYRKVFEISDRAIKEFREILESGPTSGEALFAKEEFLWRGTDPGRSPLSERPDQQGPFR